MAAKIRSLGNIASKVKTYVDTSAFIAALDRSNSFHPLFRTLFLDPPKLTTSSLVVAEGQAWFLRRFDSYKSLQFLDFIESLPMLSMLSVGKVEIAEGKILLQKFSDQQLTLVDVIGLSIMKNEKITKCWY